MFMCIVCTRKFATIRSMKMKQVAIIAREVRRSSCEEDVCVRMIMKRMKDNTTTEKKA